METSVWVLGDDPRRKSGLGEEKAKAQEKQLHSVVPWPTFKFSRTPATVRSHPPLSGEHTEEVLTGLLGYSQDFVKSLSDRGVI